MEYLFGTVLPCFMENGIKKYATLVIAYLKRSFEEKSFHFFYWSDIIIHYNSYNIYCYFLVFALLFCNFLTLLFSIIIEKIPVLDIWYYQIG